MKNIYEFLDSCDSISYKKLTKSAFSFCGENKNVSLSGKCKNTILEAKLTSNSGAVLYSISEDCLKEEYVLSRIKDMHKMFEQAALIEMTKTDDLERKEDDDKELLLDDADIEELDDAIEETEEAEVSQLEDNSMDITSLSQFKDELIDLASRAERLTDIFDEEDLVNRSMIIGLISGIYSVAQDAAELEEDLAELEEESEVVKESICVPAKTDYIDLASKGLSQACFALNKVDNFKELVGMLKDIKSELATSK